MSSVFTPCAGGVHRVQLDCEGGAGAFTIAIDGGPFILPITGFALEQQGNFQFLHTVNEFIYLYTFGDRVGELVVTGMGFYGDCSSDLELSICKILNFYNSNRIAKRGSPITISFGDCRPVFLAFLTGMRVEISKPEISVAQWVLRFNVMPPD